MKKSDVPKLPRTMKSPYELAKEISDEKSRQLTREQMKNMTPQQIDDWFWKNNLT